MDPKAVALRRSAYPTGRESTPEEIAEGVYYLGSDLSPTVTGTDLVIDSGITDCLLPFSVPKDFDEEDSYENNEH